jgi:hypothetical protein
MGSGLKEVWPQLSRVNLGIRELQIIIMFKNIYLNIGEHVRSPVDASGVSRLPTHLRTVPLACMNWLEEV